MSYSAHSSAIIDDGAQIGANTKIWHFTHVCGGAKIGEKCSLGQNVFIGNDVKIGNNVKIQNNVSIYQGVLIEDGVFLGPHVCFTNDKFPRAINPDGTLKTVNDWQLCKTLVKKGASIGANSTILPGITIGEFAMVGAGSVVTKDVPDYAIAFGNPARIKGKVSKTGQLL